MSNLPVFQINHSSSNRGIGQYIIKILDFNLDFINTWQLRSELKHLKEAGVSGVALAAVPRGDLLVACGE